MVSVWYKTRDLRNVDIVAHDAAVFREWQETQRGVVTSALPAILNEEGGKENSTPGFSNPSPVRAEMKTVVWTAFDSLYVKVLGLIDDLDHRESRPVGKSDRTLCWRCLIPPNPV